MSLWPIRPHGGIQGHKARGSTALAKTPHTPIDFDSPWKEALEEYLEDFFALFFPEAHADIDWARGFTFLDKELQQVTRDAKLRRRLVDKLVQVWRRDGADIWVLAHIEVQSQEDAEFARRMFVYYYRLFDRYARQVASLAVLGDERANWRPTEYATMLWGCALRFSYPVVKLADYRERRDELETSDNPFATVVLAHLAAQDTRRSASRRRQVKLALTRRLYERGYNRERVLSLFRFIDWLLALPEKQETTFWREIQVYEEERAMPYITSVQRIGERRGEERGERRGEENGKREALRRIVRARFQTVPEALERRIVEANHERLDQMLDRVSVVQTVDERVHLKKVERGRTGLRLRSHGSGRRLRSGVGRRHAAPDPGLTPQCPSCAMRPQSQAGFHNCKVHPRRALGMSPFPLT